MNEILPDGIDHRGDEGNRPADVAGRGLHAAGSGVANSKHLRLLATAMMVSAFTADSPTLNDPVATAGKTRLYFCHATDANGDSLDWFVEACSPDQAMGLWQQALYENGFDIGDAPIRIWEVPALTGAPAIVNWYSDEPSDPRPSMLQVVGGDAEA